jgi:addiction module HigA family antidote
MRVRLPKKSFHPGEMLQEEFLVPGKMTQAALAQKLGWTRARLNELIKGMRDITADSALDLARVLGTSAKLWMNLQATFDLDKAMRRRKIA